MDKNIPWRIIADIASQPMLQYAQAYGLGKTDIILNSGFMFISLKMTYLKNFLELLKNLEHLTKKNHALCLI